MRMAWVRYDEEMSYRRLMDQVACHACQRRTGSAVLQATATDGGDR